MKKNLILLVVLIVLGALAYLVISNSSKSTLASNPLSNFAIEDTASVTKIFISDKVTGSVLLERDKVNGGWTIDGEYKAKDRSVEICLQAIKNITVRGPVAKNMQKNIISNAAGTGKKIEIYTDNAEVPEKIWISAGNTADHHGDFFILNIPSIGISPEPFVVDMPMFGGYISARFHTEKENWRYSGIFDYPNLEYNEVTVLETAQPENSFNLQWDGGENFKVTNPISGKEITQLDSANTKDYIIRYKKIHLETYNNHLSQHQIDSVLQRTPDWKISLANNAGETTNLDLFYLPGNDRYTDGNDGFLPYNQDIMYGTLGDGELFRVQYAFVFKPLLVPFSFFGK